jgi:hypothetical protein
MVLCILHGLSAKTKAIQLIDQMIANGDLTGKFWRVIEVQGDQITITKYQRTITLAIRLPRVIRIGDKISFVSKLASTKGRPERSWLPLRIRLHGTSSFKFILSMFSVLIVITMALRYFRFDKESLSITFEEGKG